METAYIAPVEIKVGDLYIDLTKKPEEEPEEDEEEDEIEYEE